MDIESQEIRNKELLKKNNEELDKLCNKICLCIGWSLVFALIIYSLFLIFSE